ncbi:hypothetical protein [Saccharothrix hoggarensis]|uniref:Uncharacterized protein n=1 Tax=Saccharothrix hoggarensis TaxID=913853 RepID=A0ABW3QP27_9PSEU
MSKHTRPVVKVRAACAHCNHQRPVTANGWCVDCASAACAHGDGDRAGLAVPPDANEAVELLIEHLSVYEHAEHAEVTGEPLTCWPCALLTTWCAKCDTRAGDMSAAERAAHLLLDRWVAVDCEGSTSAAVRAFYWLPAA